MKKMSKMQHQIQYFDQCGKEEVEEKLFVWKEADNYMVVDKKNPTLHIDRFEKLERGIWSFL